MYVQRWSVSQYRVSSSKSQHHQPLPISGESHECGLRNFDWQSTTCYLLAFSRCCSCSTSMFRIAPAEDSAGMSLLCQRQLWQQHRQRHAHSNSRSVLRFLHTADRCSTVQALHSTQCVLPVTREQNVSICVKQDVVSGCTQPFNLCLPCRLRCAAMASGMRLKAQRTAASSAPASASLGR